MALPPIKNCPHGCDPKEEPCEFTNEEYIACGVCGATGANAYEMCPDSLSTEALEHIAILLWNARTSTDIEAAIGLANEPTDTWLRTNDYIEDAEELYPSVEEEDEEQDGEEEDLGDEIPHLAAEPAEWRTAARSYGEFLAGVEYKYRELSLHPEALADGVWYAVPDGLFPVTEEVE